jgi:hypothetical protein
MFIERQSKMASDMLPALPDCIKPQGCAMIFTTCLRSRFLPSIHENTLPLLQSQIGVNERWNKSWLCKGGLAESRQIAILDSRQLNQRDLSGSFTCLHGWRTRNRLVTLETLVSLWLILSKFGTSWRGNGARF